MADRRTSGTTTMRTHEAASESCDAQAGPEIGRWITAFGRGIGHWLLDVTPIAPLLASARGRQRVNVTIYAAPWAGDQGSIPWLATLTLRVTDSQPGGASPGAAVVAPWAQLTTESGGIAAVFRWIAFNQSYNQFFAEPFRFELDEGTTHSVRLYAVITGHGNDNHGCGEFCATEHTFSFDGGPPLVRRQMLPVTNQQLGCAEEVDSGVRRAAPPHRPPLAQPSPLPPSHPRRCLTLTPTHSYALLLTLTPTHSLSPSP